MIANFGNISILLALIAAALGIVGPLFAARAGHARYSSAISWSISAQFLFVTLAAAALIYALVATDF